MFHFILGGAKSGKSTLISQKITALCRAQEGRVLLIVPEQFSFEAEKQMFETIGSALFQRLKVTSFTRLAGEIFKKYGSLAGVYANDCAKTVMMDRAIEQVQDALTLYQKSAKQRSVAVTMLDTVTELKNAGISPNELQRSAQQLEEGYLKSKLIEISLIYGVYDALLANVYFDPLDDILRAVRVLADHDYFSDCCVFIDEFKGFTATELALMKLILQRAKDTYLSLCLDLKAANESENSAFASVYDTYNTVMRQARQLGVGIRPSILLEQAYFSSPALVHLERTVFSAVIPPYDGEQDAITAVLCKNEYDEVDYALSTIRKLVQEDGYHYREILVLSRDLDSYRSQLTAAFEKYDIPFYTDRLSDIGGKPLIRFVQNLLNCVTKGYTSENVLGMLKCGMTAFSVEEIAALENYVYVWSVKGRQWREPFTANPRGYQEGVKEEDVEGLARINEIRSFADDCISSFQQEIKSATGIQFCIAIVNLLERTKAKERIEALIENFLAEENFAFAQDYSRVWEILMELLDTLAVTIGDAPIKAERFQELFSLVTGSYDMGTLPQAIDTVIVGSADRIRTVEKKVVFLLGANENIFPYVAPATGIFTDKERQQLIALNISLMKPSVGKLKEERFIAYKTLTAPSEKLFITARKADISGTQLSQSVIFAQLKKMFGESVVTDTDALSGLYFCRSKQTAFSYLAKTYFVDNPLTATLKETLSRENGYAEKLEKLAQVSQQRDFAIVEKTRAAALFGKEMNISPTRVEGFYQCHFRYFCEHGLRAYPLKKAELNPLETGTLIHSVLYTVTKQVDLKHGYDEEKVKVLIQAELDRYIEEVMGGAADKSKRFLYLYHRMLLSILKIIQRLHAELLQSEFEPCDFEYEISENAEVTPLKLYGDNDTVIRVAGKIDRVDCYVDAEGQKYIRIVDYKSGKKEFNLNDVLYGLNLQMLIYLHCMAENGKGKYTGILPAGILYMPAGEQNPTLPRDADEEKIQAQKLAGYRMNGLLLDDPAVLAAMESPMKGLFIPVSTNGDGSFSARSQKSLVSLTQLSRINRYLDELIVKMANELHDGRIEAVPIGESCSYCNYQGVCGVDPAKKKKEMQKFDSHSDILKEMDQQSEE